jgi:hypothetical protein
MYICIMIILYYHFFFKYKDKHVTIDALDELCTWTYKHSIYTDVTITEICDLYNKFIAFVDDVIMDGNNDWSVLRK